MLSPKAFHNSPWEKNYAKYYINGIIERLKELWDYKDESRINK